MALVKKTSAASSAASDAVDVLCPIDKIRLHHSSSSRLAREQFITVLKEVSGLSADDQNKYAKLFVKEKI